MSRKDLVKWVTPEAADETSGVPIKIIPVLPSRVLEGIFLSDHVHACMTHWINRRTKPCIGVENGCEGCQVGSRKRRKGYAAIYTAGEVKVWLMEITDQAFDTCIGLCRLSGLRGVRFKAKRVGQAKNSALKVELIETEHPNTNIPSDLDVPEILSRIWFGRSGDNRQKGNGKHEE